MFMVARFFVCDVEVVWFVWLICFFIYMVVLLDYKFTIVYLFYFFFSFISSIIVIYPPIAVVSLVFC
jgi:hypothetical protein